MKKNRSAFTLIELIIVIACLMIFFTMFNMSGYGVFLSTQNIRNTYNDIDFSVQGALRESIAGYGGGVMLEKNNINILPEDYMVYFQKSDNYDIISGNYFILRNQTRIDSNGKKYTRVINRIQKEYIDSGIYLKRILGKNSVSDPGTELSSVAVDFKNPTGKEIFFVNTSDLGNGNSKILSEDRINTIHEFLTENPDTRYTIIELEFWGMNEKKVFTYKIFSDKQFYISTH